MSTRTEPNEDKVREEVLVHSVENAVRVLNHAIVDASESGLMVHVEVNQTATINGCPRYRVKVDILKPLGRAP